jgi:hypothetical protein
LLDRRLALLVLMLPLAFGESRAEEQVTSAADRTALSLAIYQGNLSLVREERRIDLRPGSTAMAVTDVPAAIMPETVLATGAPADRLRVVGQVLENGVLSPEALLEASVGKTVRVIRTNPVTGEESLIAAEVLRAQGRQGMLRVDGRIRTVNVEHIAFEAVPEGLRDRPTLVLDLDGSGTGGRGHLVVRYLTGGLNWAANYVAELSEDESAIRLTGWVSLSNNSGVAFDDASLRLVSASINRADRPEGRFMVKSMAAMAQAAPAPAESVVSDLHVFDFDRKISIGGNETRQLTLLPEAAIPVQKEYRLEGNGAQYGRQFPGQETGHPTIRFRFANKAAEGLGRALPDGVMRVYAGDAGGPVLLGEDHIPYAAVGEDVKITVGQALDITSERRQTDFRRDGLPKGVQETEHAITLRNAKDRDVSVTVIERIPGDWTMLSESQSHEKESSGEATWDVAVPAGGEATLTYRVRIRF